MQGLKICAKLAYPPNKLKYCGPNQNIIKEFIEQDKHQDKIQQILEKFEGLYPYLKLIANKHNLKPFDKQVIEAYWFGNKLLESFNKQEIEEFIKSLKVKIPKNLPNNPLPSHLFNVIFVGVGQITKKVETTLENMEKCRISWGEVKDKILVRPLLFKDKFYLGEPIEKDIKTNLKENIALHWNEPILELNNNQLSNLKLYTQKTIDSFNYLTKTNI